jgi:PAS domain S-box-containing protein
LRRAELELRESEERYRFLSNATLEGVVAIQDGLVEEANQSAAQIYGYAKPEEIIGKTYSKLVAPEYLPEVQQLVAENYDKPYETLLVRKDGSYFPAEIQGKTLEYHGQLLRVGTVRDITERKKAEEALAAEQAQRENKSNLLRAVLNLLPVGVTIMNTEGQIVERNLADWTLWDENPYETVPVAQQPGYKAWWVSTGQPIGPEEWPAARALLKGEIALDEEIYIESFAGHKKTFLNSAVPIRDEAGVITNAVSVNVDITDRKHSEEALRNSEERYRQLNIQLEQRVTERTAQLEAANHELAGEINERVRLEEELREALKKERELSELKSRFVSMTSHEFRTPLSAILTNAELLRRYNHRWTEEKKVELFQRIETSTRHMTNMLDDILLIGKAESGKLEFNPMPLDITSFCQNMVEEFQLSSGSGYQLEFIQQGTASVAWLDEKLMRQIVGNLLSNAIKYSPPGSTVRFELNCEKNGVILKIKDQGIGIPPEDQARMFEVFHRAKNVGTIQGTGLGLTIVKRSVDLHSGTITVESEVKAGTTFTIWLPARKN